MLLEGRASPFFCRWLVTASAIDRSWVVYVYGGGGMRGFEREVQRRRSEGV